MNPASSFAFTFTLHPPVYLHWQSSLRSAGRFESSDAHQRKTQRHLHVAKGLHAEDKGSDEWNSMQEAQILTRGSADIDSMPAWLLPELVEYSQQDPALRR